MKLRIVALILLCALLLTACKRDNGGNNDGGFTPPGGSPNGGIADDNSSYGESLEELGAMDGFFDGSACDIDVVCISGTQGCYNIEGNTLSFTALAEDSVYLVSGRLCGNIVIDIGETHKLELELQNFSLVSNETNPITILSGDKVSIQAKKDSESFIYDTRPAISEDDTASLSGAIHSEVDLEISGKGRLSVVSSNNNGIHSKKDLSVKNLDLTVSCKDNALKGNDSVSLEAVKAILIASLGDCIKTTKSDISEKGNQRGSVSFLGGSYELYAACDGIDAAYDVIIDGADTYLNIYTDKYSNYSERVTDVSESEFYIRFSYSEYKYSVMYYNSDSDYLWVDAEYHSTASGSRGDYYYHSFPKNNDYSKLRFFMYSSDMEQGQDGEYVVCSDYITPSETYDTISLSVRGGYIYYDWTNYSTTVNKPAFGPGPGGMGGGNTEKGDHSTKGVKANNEIIINDGAINVKSYDDAFHVKNDSTLENGASALGNLSVNGGYITIYSNDDGIHADGIVTVNDGRINILHSYEGIEGNNVRFFGGSIRVNSNDDGVNATATSGASITIGGGVLYIYCGGDGVDSNSRTSYGGISFTGGRTLIISTSGGNSAIDSESGYSYTGGSVVAIMPNGAMTNEATKCENFYEIAKKSTLSMTEGKYLVCEIGDDKLTVNMPVTISGYVIILGDSEATATTHSSSSHTLSKGEFVWE